LSCPDCGYPLSSLEKTLIFEKEASMGWAEKIITVPVKVPIPPPDAPLTSFACGKIEPETEPKQGSFRCERCGFPVELGDVCPHCKDKLPGIIDNDPYIALALRSLIRIILAPRQFALKFPYPMSGGILQALLYPGIAAAFMVVTYFLMTPEVWLNGPDAGLIIIPSLIEFMSAMIIVPGLIYFSSWFIGAVGKAMGSRVPVRRIIRIGGALVIWAMILGFFYHLIFLGLFSVQSHQFQEQTEAIHSGHNSFQRFFEFHQEFSFLFTFFYAWYFSWTMGPLFRFKNGKLAAFLLITFVVLAFVWAYFLVLLPNRVVEIF
jgi:hypothetical protein